MNIPKNFLPNKEYTFEELKKKKRGKKKKIKNIEDFVLEPVELGIKNIIEVEDFTEVLELAYIDHIKRADISNAVHILYDGEFPDVLVYEFRTEELLKKRMKDIYAEANPEAEIFYTLRPLIVGKYALILIGTNDAKAETDHVEKVYIERFGAKRLFRKEVFELK